MTMTVTMTTMTWGRGRGRGRGSGSGSGRGRSGICLELEPEPEFSKMGVSGNPDFKTFSHVFPTSSVLSVVCVCVQDVRKAYQRAMDSMARLNRTASRLMHKVSTNTSMRPYPNTLPVYLDPDQEIWLQLGSESEHYYMITSTIL